MWSSLVQILPQTVSIVLLLAHHANGFISKNVVSFKTCNQRKLTVNITGSKSARSAIDCAVQCVGNDDCSSATYTDGSNVKNCELSSYTDNGNSCDLYAADSASIIMFPVKEEKRCLNGGVWDHTNETCIECQHMTYGKYCDQYVEDCNDAWLTHVDKQNTGTFNILIKPKNAGEPFMIVCKMLYSGVIVAAKRMVSAQPSENFFRSWNDYKLGFGDLGREYFLGLQKLHLVTQKYFRFKILVNVNGAKHGANYLNFMVDNETSDFALRYNSFTPGEGFGGDGLNFGPVGGRLIDGVPFCTFDKDCNGCASLSSSGWWFNTDCANVNLHGSKNASGSFEWLVAGELAKVDSIEYWLLSY